MLDLGKHRILILQTGFIGDVVLSTPLIETIKEIYPNSEISILTTPLAAEIFSEDFSLKEVIKFDKRKSHSGVKGFFTFLKLLRNKKFDIVFSLHKSARTSLLLRLSGIPKRYGFRESALAFLYTKVAKRSKAEHDAVRNLSLLKVLDLDFKNYLKPLKIRVSEETIKKAYEKVKNFHGKKIVAVAPGSVWFTKTWTAEGFSELCSSLIDKNYAVVLIGGPDDVELGKKIEVGFKSSGEQGKHYLNLIGKLSILESVALINCSDLVVANDSAPLHFASSAQKPVVSIFCATIPEFGFGPWMTKNKIVEVKNLGCRPCGRHGGRVCPTGTNACRLGISSESVFDAVIEMMP